MRLMNNKVNIEFKGIHDIYILQCMCTELKKHIIELEKEKNKFKNRCYKTLKIIRDNYGVLDKYDIDILDDILTGGEDNE